MLRRTGRGEAKGRRAKERKTRGQGRTALWSNNNSKSLFMLPRLGKDQKIYIFIITDEVFSLAKGNMEANTKVCYNV